MKQQTKKYGSLSCSNKIIVFKVEPVVNPICPHLKCSVDWNRPQKSWDCPCHGSRFGVNGEILTGPARRKLEVIAIENLNPG